MTEPLPHIPLSYYMYVCSSTGGLSRLFQGYPLSEPAVVHQHHHGHYPSLPQAEAQGKGELPAVT